jgi:hypothetical protein
MEGYFAHLNSAKCCQNKPAGQQADQILFDNCRQYIGPECAIFEPHIIVTQGDKAKEAVGKRWTNCEERTYPGGAGKENIPLRIVDVGPRTAVWFHTYHPNQRGGLYHQQRKKWVLPGLMAQAAHDLLPQWT